MSNGPASRRSQSTDGALRVGKLTKLFGDGKRRIVAVNDVSFEVKSGESLGLAGESGSGKTTIARCVAGLTEPTRGDIEYDGVSIGGGSERAWKRMRPRVQMVFQDPFGSLDPRWTARRILNEPLRLNTSLSSQERTARIRELLLLVNLDESFLNRYPHQMSGGQQQRVCIARALATEPDLLILDEPTSALDAISRSVILGLLNELRVTLGLTYLFISHDLDAVARVSDRIIVLYSGQIMEDGPTSTVLAQPRHPYTIALRSAILKPKVQDVLRGKQRAILAVGEPSTSDGSFSGCPLHSRCPIALPACVSTPQQLTPVSANQRVACMRVSNNEETVEWPREWRTGASLAQPEALQRLLRPTETTKGPD